jgi:hypothetical protein
VSFATSGFLELLQNDRQMTFGEAFAWIGAEEGTWTPMSCGASNLNPGLSLSLTIVQSQVIDSKVSLVFILPWLRFHELVCIPTSQDEPYV